VGSSWRVASARSSCLMPATSRSCSTHLFMTRLRALVDAHGVSFSPSNYEASGDRAGRCVICKREPSTPAVRSQVAKFHKPGGFDRVPPRLRFADGPPIDLRFRLLRDETGDLVAPRPVIVVPILSVGRCSRARTPSQSYRNPKAYEDPTLLT